MCRYYVLDLLFYPRSLVKECGKQRNSGGKHERHYGTVEDWRIVIKEEEEEETVKFEGQGRICGCIILVFF